MWSSVVEVVTQLHVSF